MRSVASLLLSINIQIGGSVHCYASVSDECQSECAYCQLVALHRAVTLAVTQFVRGALTFLTLSQKCPPRVMRALAGELDQFN